MINASGLSQKIHICLPLIEVGEGLVTRPELCQHPSVGGGFRGALGEDQDAHGDEYYEHA
jgi:hypothetical protein